MADDLEGNAAAAAKHSFKSKPNGATNATAGLHDSLAPIKPGRLTTLAQIGEDWLYLALLGVIMALLSFSMDTIITLFLNTRLWLSEELGQHGLMLEYSAWCLVPILLVTFSTGFVHLCSPTVSTVDSNVVAESKVAANIITMTNQLQTQSQRPLDREFPR